MKTSILITLDNPYFEEEVLIDTLGYDLDTWKELEWVEQQQAVLDYLGLTFEETE